MSKTRKQEISVYSSFANSLVEALYGKKDSVETVETTHTGNVLISGNSLEIEITSVPSYF